MKSVPPRGSGWVRALEKALHSPTRYREQLCFLSSRFLCNLPFCIRLDHDVDDR